MPEYRLTPRAQRDLRDIWRYIAVENERAADKLIGKLFDKFELIASNPHMGPARSEIASDVRLVIEGRYIAIYEPTAYGVLVVAVVHGMREPSQWLE
ncbi:MAG: plasmid stabilization protein [Rhizobiales bacterium 63-7]|nr:type II toxin-antitoxin system RelE/ParE family toxin [Hyphomicrobiales bacterium]OJU70395.1 MAG: plasmid stabilization protein [Rhizobiales bacterium 63-7]